MNMLACFTNKAVFCFSLYMAVTSGKLAQLMSTKYAVQSNIVNK